MVACARLLLGGLVGAAAVERERREVNVSLRGGRALGELVERREAVRVRWRPVELVVAELRLTARLLLLVFVPARSERRARSKCEKCFLSRTQGAFFVYCKITHVCTL